MALDSKLLLHPDLSATYDLLYGPGGYDCSLPIQEEESSEYGAYTFDLNGKHVRFRVAKITPTKIGQFVTLWKRIGKGPIQPFDQTDDVDFFVVSVRREGCFGQFVFPKSVLVKQSVIAKDGKGGKRAIRVYPPWDKPTSAQGLKTQMWQIEYFLEIPGNTPVDLVRCRALFAP